MTSRPTSAQRDRLRRIIARTQPGCAECGQPIDYTLRTPHPDSYELDHIEPLANGGAHTLDNVRALHRRCNRAKGTKPHSNIIRRSQSLS